LDQVLMVLVVLQAGAEVQLPLNIGAASWC
jgi:hypothetical protein